MDLKDVKAYLAQLDLDTKVKALAAKASPRATSSRLIVTVLAAAALIWLFKGNLAGIVHSLVALVAIFLICRTITDVATIVMDGLIKRTMADNLTKDGSLSEDDENALNK